MQVSPQAWGEGRFGGSIQGCSSVRKGEQGGRGVLESKLASKGVLGTGLP